MIGLSIHDASIVEATMRDAGAVAFVPKSEHLEALVPTICALEPPGSGNP